LKSIILKLTKDLADVLSPMLAHAQDIKKRHPEAKVIFFGPCISKKNEVEMYPGYDEAALTFLELERWLSEKNIEIASDPNPAQVETSLARLFPIEGGILATMAKDNPKFTYLSIGGMDEAIAALQDIASGKIHHAFIEMSSCSNSCINGPAMPEKGKALVSSILAIKRSAGPKDFKVDAYEGAAIKKAFYAFKNDQVVPSESAIKEVLAKIGKTRKEDELNCSSCGYATCRDKAIAVLQGKANLEMCLPFLMGKAKSFSNSIVANASDPIVVLDESLKIQLANPALLSLGGHHRGKRSDREARLFLNGRRPLRLSS
jgi:PAS domain-containing protein